MDGLIMAGRIPNRFHFVFGLKKQTEPFHLMHYLCIESCFQINHPQAIYFYYHYEPHGPYWELAKQRVILERVPMNPFVKKYRYGFKKRYNARFRYAHHSDFIRVEKLLERGGVYADMDTIFVNPIPAALYGKPFVIGREDDIFSFSRNRKEPSLCNAFLMSEPNSRFAALWLQKMRDAFDGTWSEHSCSLAHRLSVENPRLLHVEQNRSFYKHMWTREDLQDFGGPREYLPADLAFMVKSSEIPVSDPVASQSYTLDQHWGNPDLDEAKNYLRCVFQQREISKFRGKQLAAIIRSSFAEEVVMGKLKKILWMA